MTQEQPFQEKHYDSTDGLRLYYRDYNPGSADKTPLLCLHGLTRNSKDFDQFSRHFSRKHRILSLDMRGRGKSAYDPDYKNYQIPVYARDVLTFLAHEKIDQVIVVGTSMGGLISMAIGAVKPDIFKAVIFNDIGPEVDTTGLERIAAFVGNRIVLQNWQQAIDGVKILCAGLFPDYGDEDWERFTRNTFRAQKDSTVIADYDPAIGTALREDAENLVPVDLWPLFANFFPIPLMTLRGENSDILSAETLDRMARAHPRFTALTVANRGHTPDLNEAVSLRAIEEFLGQVTP